MIILTIRSDNPQAEIGLYQDAQQLAYVSWQAHKQLAETIHLKIKDLLDEQQKSLQDLQGIIAYQGPGSFTGLRIGISVANAFASGLQIPIVGAQGEGWLPTGIKKLQSGQNDRQIVPEYGAPPHITKQKR